MSNEISHPLPTEVLVTQESLETEVKQLRSGVESHAQNCTDYTQYFFEKEGKDFNAFIQEVSQEPFNIVIDPKSPTSIATGIFDLQHLLGMRLKPGYKNSCDGKFGPNTNKEYEKARDSYKLNAANKAKVQDLHAAVQPTVAAQAPNTLVEPNEPVRPAETVQTTVETNNQLPETSISKTLFVGDSLTVGMETAGGINGSIRPEKYDHKVFTHKKGIKHDKWKGVAIGGQQTPAMLNALKHAEAANELSNGERMVVWGGVNDIGSTRDPEQIAKTLLQMYLLAAKNNMSIVACTLTPWVPTPQTIAIYNKRWQEKLKKPYPYTSQQLVQRMQSLNEWITNRAKQEVLSQYPNAKFTVVDLHTEVTNNEQRYGKKPSELHFGEKGSQAIANYITSQARIKKLKQ